MKSFAVLAMCCAGAKAFVPVPKGSFGVKAAPQHAASSSSSSTVMMAKSAALPFMDSPATLDGSMVGDFGFDPLGLTENINIPYGESKEKGAGLSFNVSFFVAYRCAFWRVTLQYKYNVPSLLFCCT